jgi:hypothetical protein
LSNSVQFETQSIITTSDNYQLKLKGLINFQSNVSEDDVITQLEQATVDYFANLSLMDTLQFFEKDKHIELRKFITEGFQKTDILLEEFVITTVDAIESPVQDKIDYSVDPNLETKKKGKGLLSRFKR